MPRGRPEGLARVASRCVRRVWGMRVHPYPQPFADITTVRGALDHLNESFSDQVEEAIDKLASPNTPIPGDAEVRDAFWALLPPDEQRRFFLRVAGNRRVWQRLKTLIGNPPYSFLRAEDEGVLRAGGICKNRVRMAHNEPTTTSYNEFRPHYEDPAGRQYRVLQREGGDVEGRLPWVGLAGGARVAADVRVSKRSMDTKRSLLKEGRGTVAAAGLAFPRVGDVVQLSLVRTLRAPVTDEQPEVEPLRAQVVFGRQRAAGSPIARLVLKIV